MMTLIERLKSSEELIRAEIEAASSSPTIARLTPVYNFLHEWTIILRSGEPWCDVREMLDNMGVKYVDERTQWEIERGLDYLRTLALGLDGEHAQETATDLGAIIGTIRAAVQRARGDR